MILFLIGCVFIGLLLTAFAAPIVIVMDRQKLKEMDDLVREFQSLSTEERTQEGAWYKAELTRLKNSIWSGDKQSVEAARDKLGLI